MLAVQHNVSLGYTEIIMGLILPYLPVWLSSHIAYKFDRDLSGTPLNIITLSIPAIVVMLEVIYIVTQSIMGEGTGYGLIGAFGLGTITFFVLFGASLILSVFVKPNKPIKSNSVAPPL